MKVADIEALPWSMCFRRLWLFNVKGLSPKRYYCRYLGLTEKEFLEQSPTADNLLVACEAKLSWVRPRRVYLWIPCGKGEPSSQIITALKLRCLSGGKLWNALRIKNVVPNDERWLRVAK